jgi:hypothetical protein
MGITQMEVSFHTAIYSNTGWVRFGNSGDLPNCKYFDHSYIADALYPPTFTGGYRYASAIERTWIAILDFSVVCNANILASKLKPAYAYGQTYIPCLRHRTEGMFQTHSSMWMPPQLTRTSIQWYSGLGTPVILNRLCYDKQTHCRRVPGLSEV